MENISEYFEYEENGFEGNIEAYTVDCKKEQLFNFLSDKIKESELLYNVINEYSQTVTVIKNINIEEEYQGQGYGAEILNNALDLTDIVILECDNDEIQRENFILEDFYKNFGFISIKGNSNPIMIYPEDLAKKIKEKYESELIKKELENKNNNNNNNNKNKFKIKKST